MIEKHTLTQEQLEQIFARSAEQAMRQREAERRAREWPHQVDELLVLVVRKVAALEARIATLEARKS